MARLAPDGDRLPEACDCGPSTEHCELPADRSLPGALAWAAERLGAVSDTPRLEAELLLASLVGRSREELLADVIGARRPDGAGPLDESRLRAFAALVSRRLERREPLAYILGLRHFRRLALASDSRALIPRPETELLVEVGIELPKAASVLDLCTGSGAVALALKDERPDLSVQGSDISRDALELARENASGLGLQVVWRHADLLAGLPEDFSALLCNPPYVAERDRDSLAPEILEHEPPAALFAGEDGLSVIQVVAAQLAARSHVRLAALEVGAGQAGAVRALLTEAGFDHVSVEPDLAGIERVVVARRGERSTTS